MYYSSVDLIDKVINLIFPMATYCVCCGKIIDETRPYLLCDNCREKMRFGNFSIDLDRESFNLGREKVLDAAISCMQYGMYERRLIFDLKYNGRTYVSRVIAQIMAERIIGDRDAAELFMAADCIIPVPVFRKKELKRGFNQAAKIGFHLGKRLEIPQYAGGLVRIRETAPQRSLSAQERFSNLDSVFAVPKNMKKKIEGKTVILLDDVYTTGATGWHCGKALKAAGAQSVYLAAFASGNEFIFCNKTKIEPIRME